MAIKISGSTIIDDGRNIVNAGVVTATGFVGDVTGTATGLSGSPNVTVGVITSTSAQVGSAVTISDSGLSVTGVITATSFVGDGTGLTGVGVGASSDVNTTGIGTFGTVVATNDLDIPEGTYAERPSNPAIGSLRYNTDAGKLELYNGTSWVEVLLGGSVIDPSTIRGVFGGGYATPTNSNVIDYITITTTGNATDFGDLTVARQYLAACSSSSRGVFGGGNPSINTLDYITIATTGNATDFGDLTVTRSFLSACSSSTRGVFGGDGSVTNIIDYITIATTGNATDFGDLTRSVYGLAACSSSTRGVFGGGFTNTPTFSALNTLDYITIATTGNATDFGDLIVARANLAACSSSTIGVFGGGSGVTNTIDYITIATTGNATDFGDLTVAREGLAACSSSTRGVFGGGVTPSPLTTFNTIDYITIATTGNATDFGDLTLARRYLSACSNDHGGLS
jgi:hypothetical protein